MAAQRWRVVFFGTPTFAVPAFKALLQGPDEVIAAVSQPDREKGRGRRMVPSPVKEVSLQYGLPLLQPLKVKEAEFQEKLGLLQPDLFVVVAFGQILPGALLSIPRYGAVNVHASLLPRYRGAAPIARAILEGAEVTGITTMMMDEGMDTGGILLQAETNIGEKQTFETLHDRLSVLGATLLMQTVETLKSGQLRPIPQDHSKATYAPPLKKEDGRINWTKAAREIDRQVRALSPWPGAYTVWKGQMLKVCRGEVREGRERGAAGLISWVGAEFIEAMTGTDVFQIREVQLEGRRRMTVREFLSGHSVSIGESFGRS